MGPAGPLGWTRQAPSSTLLLILRASTQLVAIAWQGCLGSTTPEKGEASPTTFALKSKYVHTCLTKHSRASVSIDTGASRHLEVQNSTGAAAPKMVTNSQS